MRGDPLERVLEARLFKKVRTLGGLCVKLGPIVKGAPDRLVLLPGGRVFLVELKRSPKEGLSPAQGLWHARAAQRGTYVHVLHGAAEIDEWIRQRADERYPYTPKKRC